MMWAYAQKEKEEMNDESLLFMSSTLRVSRDGVKKNIQIWSPLRLLFEAHLHASSIFDAKVLPGDRALRQLKHLSLPVVGCSNRRHFLITPGCLVS